MRYRKSLTRCGALVTLVVAWGGSAGGAMAENWYKALSDEMANGVSATDAVGAVLGGPAGMAKLGMSTAARMIGEGNGGSWSFDREEIDAVIAD